MIIKFYDGMAVESLKCTYKALSYSAGCITYIKSFLKDIEQLNQCEDTGLTMEIRKASFLKKEPILKVVVSCINELIAKSFADCFDDIIDIKALTLRVQVLFDCSVKNLLSLYKYSGDCSWLKGKESCKLEILKEGIVNNDVNQILHLFIEAYSTFCSFEFKASV